SPTRSWRRPVPMPRSLLRFLASCSRPTLAKVLLAHCLRGLTLDRRSGEVRGRGTVKASWIGETFSISLRAAKSARASLILLGLIGKDTGSVQKKLNRDGAYFELNLVWSRTNPAPRASAECQGSAPPKRRLQTPSDLKDQKTRSGVLTGPDFRN